MRLMTFLLLTSALPVGAIAASASIDAPLAALRSASDAPVTAALKRDSGKARLLRTEGDLLPDVRATSEQKARVFFDRHGAVLGLSGSAALEPQSSRTDEFGTTILSYTQTHRGVKVAGSWIKAGFRADGSLYAVAGDVIDSLDIDTRPQIPSAVAARTALNGVAAMAPFAGLGAGTPELVIHRLHAHSNSEGLPVLAWQIEVGNRHNVREIVFVDARNGKIVDRYSALNEALNRRIYNGGFSPSFLVWSEGDGTPYGDAAIDNLIDFTADTYAFFDNLTDGSFLSWDGLDGIMHAVNNDPGISCPNANWNGVSINFCDGTSSDDVVGHEWMHAYTQSTHGLIYRWQSGALNESYSDIFGEAIDMLNAAGTDAPGALRSTGVCSSFRGSLPPTLDVLSPAAIAGGYAVAGAVFNPASADISGAPLVLVSDGVGATTDGCESMTGLGGVVALIDRGSCTFVQKVLNAQAAGAVGVVIANNAGEDLVNMGGSSAGISIPSVFVGQSDGALLRSTPETPSVSIAIGGPTENSLRWLMGEDATAFGGAIRDMWEPRCLGDPGKVGDAEYHCNGDVDNGGVHINSGIPNHAFALLVDGGSFNGQTIASIGLDKAAHIYWRAATNYQGPTSNFVAHADALEASCADLTGLSLSTLSTEAAGPGGTVVITPADCAAVAAAMSAVEMRDDPVRCGFGTLLAQDPPALCGAGTSPQSILSEDFEGGLGAWTVGRRAIVNAATFSGPDWSVVSNLPHGRSGQAAYGPDLILGNCSTDIEAGVVYLESPVFVVPAGTAEPRLAFDHNVATEANWDGANVKISVNGGAYSIVPAAAFEYNAYNVTLVASDNPMAGEPAFSGADDGSLSSKWGQSQINLAGLAAAGDSVRLRFELGMDGCNGLDGWYVDDVQVYACAASVDTDGDLIADAMDNCIEVANADQRDTDADGYGNICDADLNNNGTVEFSDLAQLSAAFFSMPGSPGWNVHADLNGDDVVNFGDLIIMKTQFFGPPGPSGLVP